MLTNLSGIRNTATGAFALFSNIGPADNPNRPSGELGSFNTANGNRALFSNTEGGINTAVGYRVLFNNTTGFANTAIGADALANNSSGNSNIALGTGAGGAVANANSVIAIGTLGQNVSNSCYIGQIYFNVQPPVGTDPDYVTVNSDGRLDRANVSSRRYKHDIRSMDKASETIYALRPVSFRYHNQYDATQTIAFGLIAEKVAEANPDLVGRNPEGQPESVRYEQINATLLNEFLKAHKIVEEHQATIAQLKKEMQTMVARLDEHDSKIQSVSDQVQSNSPDASLALGAGNDNCRTKI
jgi:hypothetical protein